MIPTATIPSLAVDLVDIDSLALMAPTLPPTDLAVAASPTGRGSTWSLPLSSLHSAHLGCVVPRDRASARRLHTGCAKTCGKDDRVDTYEAGSCKGFLNHDATVLNGDCRSW